MQASATWLDVPPKGLVGTKLPAVIVIHQAGVAA